jgi:hypothetical protein
MSVHRPIDRLASLAPRLGPRLGKLASDHDGEVVAAARVIRRLLDREGLTLTDLGAALVSQPVQRVVYDTHDPPPAEDWLCMVEHCAAMAERLNERDAGFVTSMCRILRRPGGTPTAQQAAWLKNFHNRSTEVF